MLYNIAVERLYEALVLRKPEYFAIHFRASTWSNINILLPLETELLREKNPIQPPVILFKRVNQYVGSQNQDDHIPDDHRQALETVRQVVPAEPAQRGDQCLPGERG